MIGNRKELVDYLLQQDDETIFEIKEKKKTRSLNANNYLWQLIGEIGKVLGKTKEDTYKSFIKDYGVYQVMKCSNKSLNTILYLWNDKGLGWIYEIIDKDEEFTNVILYYGSSSYNTKQMSRLLDAVVQDSKELGIITLDDIKIQELINEW